MSQKIFSGDFWRTKDDQRSDMDFVDTTEPRWWYERYFGTPDKTAKVRSYWGEERTEEEPPQKNEQKTSAELFATDRIDDADLAAIGRNLLRAKTVEERARLTRNVRGKPPGWEAKVDQVKRDILADKKLLAQRQQKRATFLQDKGDLERDKERAVATQERLKKGFSFFGRGRRQRQPRASYDPDFPPPPPREDDDDDGDFPPPPDDIEQRAVVDLFWKGDTSVLDDDDDEG